MKNNHPVHQRLLTTMLSIIVALMFSFSAEAASCKGKPQSSCAASSSCNWVNGYKRQDGVKVSGHCRAKAGKSNTEKSSKKHKDKKAKDKKAKDDKNKSKNKKDKKKKKNKKS